MSCHGGTGGSGLCGNVTIGNGNVTAKGGNGGIGAPNKNGGNGGDAIHGDCTGYGILITTPGTGGNKGNGGSNGQPGVAISGTDTMIRHEHSFTYSVDGATITANCIDGCWLEDHKATLTINAPSTSIFYTFKKYQATVSGDTEILGTPAITYLQQDENGEFTKSTGEVGFISTWGTFRASITAGGVTASVEFMIYERATTPSITQQPTDLCLQNGQTTGNVLTVVADGIAGHTLSYQWFSKPTKDENYGTPLNGATEASYTVPTDNDGTFYYCCVVTAIRTDNSQTATATSDVATVTVTSKTAQTLTFAESTVSKTYGDAAFTITATGAETTVTYSSGNTDVATVNASTGEVTIVGAGEATITATAATDETYQEATASYTLTVNPRSVTITGLSASDK